MTQAIRQTSIVQSDGRVEIQTPQLLQGAKVEVIILFEKEAEKLSAEALAIQRLGYLEHPECLITGIVADQEIDEQVLQAWVATHGQ